MEKKFYYSIILVNVISILFCLMSLKNLSNELIFLPLCIITSSTIFLLIKANYVTSLKLTRKVTLMSIGLCFLFFLMLPITSCLERLYLFKNIFDVIFKFFFLLSLFFSLVLIFVSTFSYECKDFKSSKKTRKLIMMIIIIISLIFIGSTTTGFYDYDFPDIWNTGSDKWSWGNWHTFGFSFLIYLCRISFNNPYPIIILNFMLYIYFCNYALKMLDEQNRNKNILFLFLFINIFTLVGFDQLRYVLKDVLFSLGFCILILAITDYLISNKFTKRVVVNLIISSIITVLFRHGALYLLILIFLVLYIVVIVKKQYFNLIYISIALAGFVGVNTTINYIGFNILSGYCYPDSVTYTVPIYQVGAFASNGYEFGDKEKEYLEEYLPIEYMANNFKKYNGDALARIGDVRRAEILKTPIKQFDYSGLIGINFNMLKNNPIFYIRSLLDLTNILWKMERDSVEWYAYFYKYNIEGDPGRKLNKSISKYNETPLNVVVEGIINIGLKKILFEFRTGGALPLFMLVLSSLILINKKKYKYILPIIFILFWYILLFLSLPIGFTRYCLPFINIYPFIFCFALSIKKEK